MSRLCVYLIEGRPVIVIYEDGIRLVYHSPNSFSARPVRR